MKPTGVRSDQRNDLRIGSDKHWFAYFGNMGLTPSVARVLHTKEIPIDSGLVRELVDRRMPQYRALPLRQLASSGSTNALFRLGEDLLVRLPRQPGGSATISKEAKWLPVVAPSLPVAVPEVLAVFEPELDYPERWSLVRWISGEHPQVVGPETPTDPRRGEMAVDLADVLKGLAQTEVPDEAVNDPDLHWYRGEPLATMDRVTKQNIERCRALGEFEFDLDAAERLWDEAVRLPGAQDRAAPRWYHGDLAAENLLVRDGRLAAILDFGGLSIRGPSSRPCRGLGGA